MADTPFSKRHGYGRTSDITIREDAPESLRVVVLETARELHWGPLALRPIVCRALRKRANEDNYSEYPNIWNEVQELVHGCDWFRVYDIIEAIFDAMVKRDLQEGEEDAPAFERAINDFFIEEGFGWQLVDGHIVTRGEEAFEMTIKTAQEELNAVGRPTAARRIHEALQDLSRRPEPDYAGAISHALSALEAVAKDVTGQEALTLGQLIAQGKLNALLPSESIRESVRYAWKYANDEGARHGKEGSEPHRDDAELIVGLAAPVATYLSRKVH